MNVVETTQINLSQKINFSLKDMEELNLVTGKIYISFN